MLGHPTIVCSVPTGTHTCFLLRLYFGHLKQCVSWRGHTAPAIFLRWDTSGERGVSPCILPLSNYGGVFSLVVPAGGMQGPGGVEPSGGRRLQPVSGEGGGAMGKHPPPHALSLWGSPLHARCPGRLAWTAAPKAHAPKAHGPLGHGPHGPMAPWAMGPREAGERVIDGSEAQGSG